MIITSEQFNVLWMLDFNICTLDINNKKESIKTINQFYIKFKLEKSKRNPLKLARQISEAIMNNFDRLTPELLNDASRILNNFMNSVDVKESVNNVI